PQAPPARQSRWPPHPWFQICRHSVVCAQLSPAAPVTRPTVSVTPPSGGLPPPCGGGDVGRVSAGGGVAWLAPTDAAVGQNGFRSVVLFAQQSALLPLAAQPRSCGIGVELAAGGAPKGTPMTSVATKRYLPTPITRGRVVISSPCLRRANQIHGHR